MTLEGLEFSGYAVKRRFAQTPSVNILTQQPDVYAKHVDITLYNPAGILKVKHRIESCHNYWNQKVDPNGAPIFLSLSIRRLLPKYHAAYRDLSSGVLCCPMAEIFSCSVFLSVQPFRLVAQVVDMVSR